MLLTLGLGSTVSDTGCVITVICDAFPKWKRWMVTAAVCLVGFSVGLVYVTPVIGFFFFLFTNALASPS